MIGQKSIVSCILVIIVLAQYTEAYTYITQKSIHKGEFNLFVKNVLSEYLSINK